MNSETRVIKVIRRVVKEEPPRHFLVDSCLKNYRKRLEGNKSLKNLFIAYIIGFCYILMIIKYSLSLFIEFDYEMKLYLYDLSVIIGGIPKYNTIFLIFAFILGLFLNIKFRLKTDNNFRQISDIFDDISDRKRVFIDIQHLNNNLFHKRLTKFTKLVYNLVDINIISLGKFFIVIIFL